MPYIPHTPESLLARSDSKNPEATCRGITSNGRPCRRALSKSPQSSPSPSPQKIPSPEAFCWQHREQATAPPSPSPQRPNAIRERTSVDTLVDRLGLLEVEQRKERKPRRKSRNVLYNEKAGGTPSAHRPDQISSPERRTPQRKQRGFLELLCCIGEVDEPKRTTRPVNSASDRPNGTVSQQKRAAVPAKVTHNEKQARPSITRDPSSRTGEFLSLIPVSATPQTTSLLLAELAKPFSESDDEGFIYMFWLTPESLPADAPSETASTLLAPPSRPTPSHRRTSDVLSTFATKTSNASNQKTMLLKIGRAQNVQRRLNQWTRQCGYNLSLIRYYPYHSSNISANEPPRTPRKVPNVNKVERLIHIELADRKLQGDGKCEACGRQHREWFEVDASRSGVKAVDEIIRRWVDWGEREASR
ncbi:meiotically up-regulated gene 113-domain-containing protein [Tricladium varicosporioides]|nr:meiotically up-regulated gene 113-domain-containing protein [Hymenoscyphus varicosporioides]